MRLAFLLIAAFFLLYSVWFFYDGFVAWPRENAEVEAALQAAKADAQRAGDAPAVERAATNLINRDRHTDMDLVLQKAIGVIFAAIGLPLLCVAFWPRSKTPLPPPHLPPPPPLPS